MTTLRDNILNIALAVLCFAGMICGGCADNAVPTNLEPVISRLSADEITRNSAVVSAEVENRGVGLFESFRFVCAGDDGNVFTSEEIRNPSGRVQAAFAGLRPGTLYILSAEGSRGDALIRSEEISFTTMSNDRPTVSRLSVLSSGPTAAIMQFRIDSDGGEPILEAGCYVSEINGEGQVKTEAVVPEGDDKDVRIHIMSLTPLSEYQIRPYAINAIGETVGDPVRLVTEDAVRLTLPGDLDKVLDMASVSDGSISISGPLDGDDFKFLRSLIGAGLSRIDISDTSIAEGGAPYDGSRFTVKDIVSTGLFADCPNLSYISLPLTCTSIERDAFARSSGLKEICFPPDVTSLFPSTGCSALEIITLADGNSVYASYDGVLFDVSLSEMIWFPAGRTKTFEMPPSMTRIRENSFTDCSLERLILPSTLTEIERYAFYGSALKEIDIPDGIRNIPEGMLQNCRNLKKVRFGASTEFIGNYILDNSPVEHLYVDATIPPYVSPEAFVLNQDLTEKCTLHVQPGCRKIYRNHPIWGKFNYITEESE